MKKQLTPGESVDKKGRYIVEKLIGAGGMGDVYKVKDAKMNEIRAVKTLKVELASNEQFLERFIREAKIAMNLNHPNIGRMFSYEEEDDFYYIIMPFFKGMDLKKWLSKKKEETLESEEPINLREAALIIRQVCEGLHAAHLHTPKIIHRDIKPQNIMISEEGHITVMDFGIAKDTGADDELTVDTGAVMGTIAYMSPEQLSSTGHVDQKADIYSAGIVFYLLLTHKNPPDILKRRGGDEIIPPSSINKALNPKVDEILLKSMALEKEYRYEDVLDVWKDLKPYLLQEDDEDEDETLVISAAPKKKSAEAAVVFEPEPEKKKPVALIAGAGLVVLIALGGFFFFSGEPPPKVSEKRHEAPERRVEVPEKKVEVVVPEKKVAKVEVAVPEKKVKAAEKEPIVKPQTFPEFVKKMAGDLEKNYGGTKKLDVFTSRNYFSEKGSRANPEISKKLLDEVSANLSLSKKIVLSSKPSRVKNPAILQANFSRLNGKFVVTLSLLTSQGGTTLSKARGEIPLENIPGEWFAETLLGKAIQSLQGLQGAIKDIAPELLYIENIPFKDKGYSDFALFFKQKLLDAMEGNYFFKKPAKLDLISFQTADLLKKKIKLTLNSSSGTVMGSFIGSKAVIRGSYEEEGNIVRLKLQVVNLAGDILRQTSVPINKDLIKVKLRPNKGGEIEVKPFKSSANKEIKLVLTTDRGEGSEYKVGQKIRIIINVGKTGYLALYNKDSSGEWCGFVPNPFFPETKKFDPGKTYVLGDSKYNFDMPISEPVGEERIAGFISEAPLPRLGFLEDSCSRDGKKIYEAYRSFAQGTGKGYGEGDVSFRSRK